MIGLLAVGAGGGAVMRYLLTIWGKARWPAVPLATLIINVTGAFIAGVLAGLMLPADLRLILLTGVCGGYTTFSTFMVDTLITLRGGRRRVAAVYFVATVILGIVALLLGSWIGGLF
ncbi:CrcB family protein [Lacticaseibacillus pabuli]|uniref:Fluoride-specific ion channel FluC n=1 Tax=Lacticaseibacillus pabuli TaxID=3025672 RepID=A0ABY7WZG8_9LACO|nr:CrcB family protein [Lacticaseibacillus sp. KACC 23028]WDF83305.1 CrcB family protein [Lacticaseibacillus sp. KACC 23028]